MRLKKRFLVWGLIAMMLIAGLNPYPISFASNSASTGPALAFDTSNDRYLMVYASDAGGGENDILGQFLSATGSPQGDPFEISGTSGTDSGAPEIIYDSDNDRFIIVWQDGRGATLQIYLTILDEDGEVLVSEYILDATSDYQMTPLLARSPDNDTFLVLWLEKDAPDDATGSLNGAYVQEDDLSSEHFDFTKKDDALSFDLTYDATNDQYVIVWDSLLGGNRTRLNVEYLDSSGETEKGVTYISPGDGEIAAPSIAYSESAGENLVVWIDESDDVDDVYSHYATTTGSAVYIMSADAGIDITEVNLVSSGTSDELLLVWSEFDGESYSVIGNYVNDDGTATGDENIVITSGSSEPVDTVIAFNPSNDNFLVMQDDGSGDAPEPITGDDGLTGETAPGTLEFSTVSSAVEETGSATVTVKRTGGSDGTVGISYQTVYQTAGSNDFMATSGTLTFNDGETQKTISVPIIEDTDDEDDEYFDIELSAPTGGALLGSADTHTVAIQDDDDPKGTFAFASSDKNVLEGDSVELIVERQLGQNGIVTVDYEISGLTADSADFTAESGTLTYLNGEDTKTLIVQSIADTETESDETIAVTLSNPSSGTFLGSPATATVTIIDDDQPTESISFKTDSKSIAEGDTAVLTVVRQGLLDTDVTVDYETVYGTAGSDDISAKSGTLTFEAGQSTAEISIASVDDPVKESTEDFSVQLTSAAIPAYLGSITQIDVTLYDNDAEVRFNASEKTVIEGQSVTLTLERDGATDSEASIDYAFAPNTASASDFTASNGTLTFSSGETVKTISVTTTEDTDVEETESFSVSLDNPSDNLQVGSPDTVEIFIIDNDEIIDSFSFVGESTDAYEGDALSIKVLRTGDLIGSETVDYTVSAGTSETNDHTLVAGTLSFADTTDTQYIEFELTDDLTLEESEDFSIILENPSDRAQIGDIDTHTVNIIDNDAAFTVSQAQQSIYEGASDYVNIVRSGYVNTQATVYYSTLSDTADSNDFTPTSGTLTFAPGEQFKAIEITTVDDFEVEPDEVFSLVLGAPSDNTQLGNPSSVEITIINDDTESTTFSFTTSSRSVTEGDSLNLTVKKSGPVENAANVDYEVISGTATSDDITIDTGTLVFTSEDSEKNITVNTTEDAVMESSETFTLVLSNPTGSAELGSIVQVTVTLNDDDSQVNLKSDAKTVVEGQSVRLTLEKSGVITESTSVAYTLTPETATTADYTDSSGSITFGTGENIKTLDIDITDDSEIESSETFSLTLGSATGNMAVGSLGSTQITILDNDAVASSITFAQASVDADEGDILEITVLRSGNLEGTSTASYTLVSGTADSEDYSTSSGTVTFLDGESSKTITIALSDDNTLEDPESFSIVLSNPDAGAELGVIKTLSVNIEDNDTLIALEQTVQTISEGDITQLYVSRTGDLNATVTVDYSILADSADASDYVLSSGTLTFLPGQQTQIIEIETTDDLEIEEAEQFSIVLVNPSGNVQIAEEDTAQIIINDNDIIQSSISFSSSSKTIEEGSYVSLTLVRTGSLSGTASAKYSFVSGTAGASDYFDINDTVHFADGESAKTITVVTKDDSLEEATESFTILLSNPSEGCALGKITEVSLLIRDNDQVLDTFTFVSGSETVDEGDSVNITVERTGSTEDEAEVDYLYVSGTADDEDYVETMGTVVFEAGETTATIKVKARVDTVDETNEYFYVLLYNPSDNVTIGDIATTIVVINNKTYTRDSRDTTQTATVETTSVTETSTTDYVKIVNDLTNVLVTKALTNDIITDQSTQTYYDKIEDLIQYIDSDDDIKLAMNDYVETVQLFENMDVEDTWIDLMLIERVQVFTETTANVENHEDLTEKFIKNIQEVEASRLNETGADLDKAIEEMVDVTLRDVGTIHDGHSVEEEDQVYTVTFNSNSVQNQLLDEAQAFVSLNRVIEDYYGDDNVRDFDFSVTLDIPKYGNNMKVEIDKDTLQVIRLANTDKLGLSVEGFEIEIDRSVYAPSEGQTVSNLMFEMTFEETNGNISGSQIQNKAGFSVDVNAYVDGVKQDHFSQPVQLIFSLDSFAFDEETFNTDKLSVFRLNDETGVWKPVGGSYNPYTNTMAVYRQKLSQYTVMQTNKTFNDIEDSSAKAEIEALLGKGIIDETASFDPGESITREEMATWIARSYGLENDDSEMPFEDVAEGSDHYSELAAAYESGIISGTSDTAFNPEGTVTKEEMAVMLANAMTQFEEKKLNENLGGELAQLSDRELIEDWADDEVAFLGELGILEDEDGTLNPDAAVTKELAASIIKRISG